MPFLQRLGLIQHAPRRIRHRHVDHLAINRRAGERQVKDARLAVATGYGMTMYRYGGTAAAAILERVE